MNCSPPIREHGNTQRCMLLRNPSYCRIIIPNEFLQDKRWEELDHPLYSPDMSPPDMDGPSALKPQTRGSNSKLEMSSLGITMRQ